MRGGGGGSVIGTLNVRLRNTGITKEKFEASNKDQQWNLAHQKQRLDSKALTLIFKIYQIVRFQ